MNSIRYILLNCAVICILAILGFQLFHLQVVKRKVHADVAHGNALRDIRVLPARGSIYDRNGVLLVHNVPKYTITVTPKYFDQTRMPLLTRHMGVADSVVVSHLKEAEKWNRYRPSPVFSNVSFEQYSRVVEDSYLLPGVGAEIKQLRNYPAGAHASHALGYIGEINREELTGMQTDSALYRQGDLLGKTGIERGYEAWLRGVPGITRRWVNTHGLEVMPYAQGQADQQPREYYDVHLALDSRVQELAESLFVNKRGAAVALDPDNGSIIALVSKPDYPLELFTDGIQSEDWDILTRNREKPLYNRATMNLMPPGSTWKPFMALFGLSQLLGEQGAEETIYCGGYHPVGGGRIFRCLGAHGHVNVVKAIQTSCNTFFFELGRRMNLSAFKEFANRFGFGIRVPTDIREQTPGLIPDSAYFNRTRDYWSQSSLMNLGIGQGDMGVTPLQLARYAAALANGGVLHPPYLVSHMIQPETGKRIQPPGLPESIPLEIDSTYMNLVRKGMRLVMEKGTGVMAQIPGIPSAGKTGTAQAPGNLADHSVFIMFAPFDNPEIAIAVQCENTGDGSQCAAPIASLLAEQYLKGEIPPSWQTDIRMKRALSAQSQSLIPESE